MSIATLTSKSQITLPKDIREYLDLHAGDKIDFTISSSGQVILRPSTMDIRQLKGLIKNKHKKTVSIEEMNNVIAKAVKEKIK